MPYEQADDTAPMRRAAPDAGAGGPGAGAGSAVRVASVVAGDYLLTVNPVDGSEVVMCPPERATASDRRTPEERSARRRAARPAPIGPAAPAEQPLLERAEDSERLVRLLGRGRSVRVTGPSGVGRSALLSAIADRCGGLAPDGVVQLSGYRRTPNDLLYDLYAAVFRAEGRRPERARLLEDVTGIGAIVVLDDLEFGGEALEELLSAAGECAFLISATPDVAAPAADSPIEEVFLRGLSKAGCRELVERAVDRPLSEKETAWVSDLWFESEGLPLRFVQAGALLKLRDAARADAEDSGGDDAPFGTAEDIPLPPLASGVAESLALRLSTPAREALRYALALGGECVHPSHLPALIGDTAADAAVAELAACGLITPVAAHYRLAAGAQRQLAGEVRRSAEYAKTAAQHYAWWSGHPSVTAERVSLEADAVLAAMAATRDHGQPAAAVQLARSAAPAFAAVLNWSAWERALRIGQEAARLAGEVAEEAYFHHELGVLALCSGNVERARTELEASIGMRGVLADRQGTVVGRRTLALVTDRAQGLAPGSAAGAGQLPALPGGEARSPVPRIPGIPAEPFSAAPTVVTPVLGAPRTADIAATRPVEVLPPPRGERGLVLSGSRRNLVAAGAGALLVALLGTVVTIGTTSGSGSPQGNAATATPTDSATQDGGVPVDQSSGSPSASASPSRTAAAHRGPSASAGTSDAGAVSVPTAGTTPTAVPTVGPTPPARVPKTPTASTSPIPQSSTPASQPPSGSGSPSTSSSPAVASGTATPSPTDSASATPTQPVSGTSSSSPSAAGGSGSGGSSGTAGQ